MSVTIISTFIQMIKKLLRYRDFHEQLSDCDVIHYIGLYVERMRKYPQTNVQIQNESRKEGTILNFA